MSVVLEMDIAISDLRRPSWLTTGTGLSLLMHTFNDSLAVP